MKKAIVAFLVVFIFLALSASPSAEAAPPPRYSVVLNPYSDTADSEFLNSKVSPDIAKPLCFQSNFTVSNLRGRFAVDYMKVTIGGLGGFLAARGPTGFLAWQVKLNGTYFYGLYRPILTMPQGWTGRYFEAGMMEWQYTIDAPSNYTEAAYVEFRASPGYELIQGQTAKFALCLLHTGAVNGADLTPNPQLFYIEWNLWNLSGKNDQSGPEGLLSVQIQSYCGSEGIPYGSEGWCTFPGGAPGLIWSAAYRPAWLCYPDANGTYPWPDAWITKTCLGYPDGPVKNPGWPYPGGGEIWESRYT